MEAEGDPTPLEHSAVGWYTPDEMTELRLAPADALAASPDDAVSIDRNPAEGQNAVMVRTSLS